MGQIEESIMNNYRQAINNGNLTQAAKSVGLAKSFKQLIENESFLDYDNSGNSGTFIVGNVLKPFSYKYDPDNCLVYIAENTQFLTETENRLFKILSDNETSEDKIHIINKELIKSSVWPDSKVTDNAVRVLIKRLRLKIEPEPKFPQILINFNGKGYVFIGKQEV